MELATELKQYLLRKKWNYRPVGNNRDIAIKTCPFCGKSKWKFYIHAEKTMYRCWHCDARGNLYKLKRDLGDLDNKLVSAASSSTSSKQSDFRKIELDAVLKLHKKLLGDEDAKKYLSDRGFSIKTINHFKLGLQNKYEARWISIPHINNGICHNVKFRRLPPASKKFRRIKGSSSVLFNEDCLAEAQSVILVEGELDAMSFWEAGVKNVVGLTGGAGTFLPEWYDLLADKDEIIIVMDADAVGQEGARNIARRIGFDRCTNVLLPLKDANEVLVSLGKVELIRALQTAEKFEVHGVVTLEDALIRLVTKSEIDEVGLLSPWHGVNRLIGRSGWQPGNLIVLSARVKTGKTTFALNILQYLAEMGNPALMYCLEMSVEELTKKVVANHRKKDIDTLATLDYQTARYFISRLPLYYIDPEWGHLDADGAFNKIRESVKRYGIKAMVFDNIHFLCRSLQYLTNEIGNVCRSFKLLAQELGIVIILIAQPKKVGDKKIISYGDIKDSSAIPADADQILILHREPTPAGMLAESSDGEETDQEVLDPKMLVRSDASRFQKGGECYLYYQGETSTLFDWSDRPQKIIED